MKLKHLTTASALLAFAVLSITSVANAQDGMKHMPGMGNMSGMDMKSAAKTGTGKGVITSIEAKDDKITIKHDAIPSVGWPAMTMTFKANPAKLLSGLKVGETVTFNVSVKGADAEVTAIQPK